MSGLKVVVSFLVWVYFKYLTYKESKKLKDKMDEIREDKAIKEAIQNGDAKEVYRIIKYYGDYNKRDGSKGIV
jgi:hypothetical protein